MSKKVYKIVVLLLSFCLLSACTNSTVEHTNTLNEADFEVDEKFITFADIPPNPLDEAALQLYIDLGLNTYVLTEDFVPMINDGTLSTSYKSAIEALEEKGLRVWIRNMYNDPDYFNNEKDKAGSNYGTPYQLSPRNITDEFSQFSAVTGFYMSDEPYMTTLSDNPNTEYDESLFAAMDQYDKMVEWKNQYYPDEFWHLNHVPSSSYDHYPGGYTYADFIQYYVDNIVAKLTSGGRSICLDNYPFNETGGTISDSYLLDLLTVANIARDYNMKAGEGQKAIYGICLQTFKNTEAGLRDITSPEDVTFQMYTGMALGARLFEYFCYSTYESFGLYGIVDATGARRIYDYVIEANHRALPFEKVLCAFDWRGLTTSKGEIDGEDDTFEQVSDLVADDTGSLRSVSSRYDAIVGHFNNGEQDGFMVVNYTAPDKNMTNVVTLKIDNCSQALVYTEDGVKKVNLVRNGELRLTLSPGEGAFVIPA